jgi:hypothetical protein
VDVLERLLARTTTDLVESAFDTPCWEWQGALSRGYGLIQNGRRSATGNHVPEYVHVVGYEAIVGPVPDGLELDHLCRNRRCWNPDHIDDVPHADNVARGHSLVAYYTRRQRCLYGHALSEPDAYYQRPDGRGRMCRQCHLERGRGRRGDARHQYREANEARRRAESTADG